MTKDESSTHRIAQLLLFLVSFTAFGILVQIVSFSWQETVTNPKALFSATKFRDVFPLDRDPASYSTVTSNSNKSAVKIAHVVSLITCSKHVQGYLAALAILRHSIHLQSIHEGKSKYDYQMYAIIHQDGGCQTHVDHIRRLGYIPIVKSSPVNLTDIRGDYYRTHVENENCCGSKEFIKLYAYELVEHPISVHWDVDVAVLQPMDELFDAMLYPKDSPQGKHARSQLLINRPKYHSQLPDRIDAFFTRDITSARPWEPHQGVQGGFMVARTDPSILPQYMAVIREGNYTPGRKGTSGWGGLGYGGFQGAMAIQGIYAYFYDQIYPNHHVELDYCRWNQCTADVIWRGPLGPQFMHQCREYPADGKSFEANTPDNGMCEDCRVLPVEEIKSVHYTACKKPWECRLPHPRSPKDQRDVYRLQQLTNITTCGKLFHKYFEIRKDLEEKIAKVINMRPSEAKGGYFPEFYMGYCTSMGSYQPLMIPDNFEIKHLYGFYFAYTLDYTFIHCRTTISYEVPFLVRFSKHSRSNQSTGRGRTPSAPVGGITQEFFALGGGILSLLTKKTLRCLLMRCCSSHWRNSEMHAAPDI